MCDDTDGSAEAREALLAFAIRLARAARQETLSRQSGIEVEDKSQHGAFDPVTDADRAAEKAMRHLIALSFPDHGITGEELADKDSAGQLSWSLDPIDGTRSYICALPSWTTLIALLKDGEPCLGLIDAPFLDEMYLGTGDRASLIRKGERSPIRTSGCERISEARFSTTDPFLFGSSMSKLEQVVQAVRVTRYGHDGYAYARLAAGSIDLVIENGLKPHDYNAVVPVVRAAGGHIGDWIGGSDLGQGQIIAAASRALYDEAVALLANA